MKTGKMNFGFSVVNAGQRNLAVEPQLVAVSTQGSFRITPPVSRALGIQNGEYIMFINNISGIDSIINDAVAGIDNEYTSKVVEFCKENELELGSAEAAIAIHKEFDEWRIAKSYVEKDSHGIAKTTTERLAEKDKKRYATAYFEQMLEQIMTDTSDKTEEARVALSREDITKDEQISILAQFVEPRPLPKYSGSKVANPAGLTGVGTPLTFTDTNVWNQLKADMEDAEKYSRVFDIDVDNIVPTEVFDGFENIVVKALVLGNYTDKASTRANKKESDAE